ncbi:hypothetical protein V6N13_096513 [Hibiscus sabdariffa]
MELSRWNLSSQLNHSRWNLLTSSFYLRSTLFRLRSYRDGRSTVLSLSGGLIFFAGVSVFGCDLVISSLCFLLVSFLSGFSNEEGFSKGTRFRLFSLGDFFPVILFCFGVLDYRVSSSFLLVAWFLSDPLCTIFFA